MTSLRRRTVLGAAAGGAALIATQASQGATSAAIHPKRRNYVLLHGTWHGGWAWQRVAGRLRAAGHRVITPTMTGCGERHHLIRPETGLYTHIDDLVHAIAWEEMDDIILVGHSWGGLTLTGAADRLRERIGHIVFYDALIPTEARPAGILRDPETGEWPQSWQDRMTTFIDGYKMIMWDFYPPEMLVPKDDIENIALLRRRITWHPMRQWIEPLRLQNGGWQDLPRTCIEAGAQVYSPSSDRMLGPGRQPGWNFVTLPVARDGFLTHPGILADFFLSLA